MKIKLVRPEGPLSEDKLAAVERQFGVTFPAHYRSFMLEYNGGRPVPAGFDILWRSDQECGQDWRTSEISRLLSIYEGEKANFLDYNTVMFKGRIPADTLAIAYDPGGNLILLAHSGPMTGKVLFWVKDREVEEGETPGHENVGVIADSFQELLLHKLR
ncbi:MAG TPA: SMI1/KNR4 family protein [Archangium sp.]|nr:SMI1/KNR4 family protein [Archangium sp.]